MSGYWEFESYTALQPLASNYVSQNGLTQTTFINFGVNATLAQVPPPPPPVTSNAHQVNSVSHDLIDFAPTLSTSVRRRIRHRAHWVVLLQQVWVAATGLFVLFGETSKDSETSFVLIDEIVYVHMCACMAARRECALLWPCARICV